MKTNECTRRQTLQLLGAGAAVLMTNKAGQAGELPLKNTGLEHYGMTVADPKTAAEFYGRIFDPQLFQERDPPPRFYVRLGTSYIAFGGNKDVTEPRIDHFCVLTEGYAGGEARKLMEEAGITFTGAGGLGMAADPDGLRLQLLGVPGGLAKSIIPATRISQDDALVQAIATDHIMLRVTDLEKSTAHYRKIFGTEVSKTTKPARVWFQVVRTRLGLEPVTSGEKPSVHHICVRVAGFDKKAVTEKLKKAGVEVVPAGDEDVVRFKDLNGLTMELKSGA
ncbi:MAG TPA: VOC family protein [Bryobacteraceae bacterium]|nr:VOC family protein [Bryobacteraceae bacterium]